MAQEEARRLGEVESLVEALIGKSEPNEVANLIFVLSEHLAALLLPRHRVMHECGCDEHSSLPHQSLMTVGPLELSHDGILSVELSEQVGQLILRVILEVEIPKHIDVVDDEGSVVSLIVILVPVPLIQLLHKLDQSSVEHVAFIVR